MKRFALALITIILLSCSDNETTDYIPIDETNEEINSDQNIIDEVLNIDLSELLNYENQTVPGYITKDNTTNNIITDEAATLGRVLFYDKNLSTNNTISCASCHQQTNAFGDIAQASTGVNGQTGRHSMRLINTRFAEETRFFWDERATTLEEQTTMPIQDHAEMGFSGTDGAPDLTDMIIKLGELPYYEVLFRSAFGDEEITETRIQNALAQFIRSIQSFDSKYDIGRSQVNNHRQDFPNFTADENAGKLLFSTNFEFETTTINGVTVSRRTSGGVNCMVCHRAPEFDIDPDSRNNGMVETLTGIGIDIDVTRSPSLRDIMKIDGTLNGGLFHNGMETGGDLSATLEHYNSISRVTGNTNLDRRLTPGGNPQFLDMTTQEMEQLTAFLRTLSGTDVYINEKWSDPFK
ncbi:cytochrome-c peroxidase [Aquimarina rhabdastrellae]